MGRRGGIRARRVRVAKERLHARRFFARQTQFGPHWGSRQSTQYQFSAGTDRMPSHLTWHVFLHVPARDASPIDRSALVSLHAIDQTRSREQRRVDGVGRRRPTVLAVAEEQIPITLLVAPTDVAVLVVPGLELLELVEAQLGIRLAARPI